MKRILLVDDPKALPDLVQLLAPVAKAHEVVAVGSRTEAELQLLRGRFDLILAEVQLIDGDGTELLRGVREHHPETIRIVLTAKLTRVEIQRVLMVAHRYLPKPCDGGTLVGTVESALALQDRLTSPTLLELASKMFTVPSIPGVYQRVMAEIENPDASVDRIADCINTDPGITAKMIQLVNSPVFAMRRPVTSTVQAVITLGLEMTKILVLTTNLFSKLRSTSSNRFSYEAIWNSSQRAGALARVIAKSETLDDRIVSDATMAGLLHEIGRLVLLNQMPDLYAHMQQRIDRENMHHLDAERAMFGATIPEVGAYLLGLWGLPSTVVEAICWHREPATCPMESFSALTALHVTTGLLLERANAGRRRTRPYLDVVYLESMGLGSRIDAWKQMMHEAEGPILSRF